MRLNTKLGPSLVVLTVAAYCCWPEEAPPFIIPTIASQQQAKALVAAAGTVSAPQRNPFVRASAEAGKPAAAADLSEADIQKQLAALVLKGTFVLGQRRVAMIDNAFYAEGEPVVRGDSTLAQVKDILEDKVVLDRAGKSFDVTYSCNPGKSAELPAKNSQNRRTQ